MIEDESPVADAASGEGQTEPDEDAYAIPDRLPSPPLPGTAADGGSIAIGLALGLGVAVAVGIGLFAAGQLFYIYILFNWAAGVAVGWGLARAPKSGFVNRQVLFAAALACSLVVYLTFNIAMYVWILADIPAGESFSFGQFLLARAEQEEFIRGIEPGVIGNIIIWTVELGITTYYAWQKVTVAAAVSQVESVPIEVIRMVLHLLGEGTPEPGVRSELAKRGWNRAADQDRALGAASALAQLAAASSEES